MLLSSCVNGASCPNKKLLIHDGTTYWGYYQWHQNMLWLDVSRCLPNGSHPTVRSHCVKSIFHTNLHTNDAAVNPPSALWLVFQICTFSDICGKILLIQSVKHLFYLFIFFLLWGFLALHQVILKSL